MAIADLPAIEFKGRFPAKSFEVSKQLASGRPQSRAPAPGRRVTQQDTVGGCCGISGCFGVDAPPTGRSTDDGFRAWCSKRSEEQRGNVVSARVHGGEIVDGYLIGRLEGWLLHFRYVQADRSGRLDSGVPQGVLDRLADGRLRLIEHYQWLTRPERGTNTFEEIGFGEPQS